MPGDTEDLESFRQQLLTSSRDAITSNYKTAVDDTVVFAISYVQHDTKAGRFKFSNEQWKSVKLFMAHLANAEVKAVRFWHDQCLWLRDASQESWAHIRIVPYTIWPVLSLETKSAATCDR